MHMKGQQTLALAILSLLVSTLLILFVTIRF
ncbi:MAG: hypothetical protein ACI8W9_000566, partial [Psychromonas sp.]